MLENAAHHHLLVAAERRFGAVAVVHVEIDDGHALQAVRPQRVARGNGDVVVEAEAHGAVRLGVVAGRAHAAERVLELARDHRIGGRHRRARGQRGGGKRVRVHRGIRIDRVIAAGRAGAFERIDIVGPVHALKLLARGGRGFAALQQPVQAVRNQVILDRLQAFRALRMEMPHLVPLELGVRVIACRHLLSSQCCLQSLR